VVWYFHLFKNFREFVVIYTVKGFYVVNEADAFLESPCFLWSNKCRQFDLWFLCHFLIHFLHLEVLDLHTAEVHYERDQPWDFFGRNDAKAETPVLWPPHSKSWLTGKDSDAGRDWGQEQKGTTENEMAGWHHWLDGRECEWTPGVGDGQGGLVCCNSWGRKESDTTERLDWSEVVM